MTGGKLATLSACCVLATFMAARGTLPGKKAFFESLRLGKKLKRACDSFVNAATIVEKSELAEHVRVRKIMDVCVAYSERAETMGKEADKEDDTHSFVTHRQMTGFLETFPVESVGVCIGEGAVQVFRRKGKVYDSILANADGAWTVGSGHDELNVLPLDDQRTELLILEPIA